MSLLLLYLLNASVVLADVANRQFLPLGERQAYMANAGVAHSADGGAGYYNPSGLTELERNHVSLTANTYFLFDLKFDSLIFIDTENVPYEASGFNMIPMAANAAWGKGTWKVALSIMVPDALQVQNRAPVDTSTTDGQILQSQLSQDLWGGLSFARKLDERWSLGITLWGIQHSETQVLSVRIRVPSVPNSVVTSMSREELKVIAGSATLGVGYQVSSSTRLGLRVQSPTFRLFGSADIYQATDSVTSGVLTSTEVNRNDLEGHYGLPLDVTAGISQMLGPVELLFDMSLQFPIEYTAVPELAGDSDVATKLAPRWSLGADWAISTEWALRSGLFYTPSAVRELKVQSSGSRFDLIGGTLGLLWDAGQIETSGGIFLVKGSGQSAPSGTSRLFDAHLTGYGAVLSSSYLF